MLSFLRERKAFSLLLALIIAYIGIRFLGVASVVDSGVNIGSKNFTESVLIGELYAQLLERGGYTVHRKFNLGGTLIAHESLKNGEIDLYPEYTGTGFLDVLRLSPPEQEADAYRKLDEMYRQKWNLRWLQPSHANNSQGLVMRRANARKLGIEKLSDLAKQASTLTLGSIPEFEEREDGLRGLRKHYSGFRFHKIALYDNGLKYRILKRGEVDVTVAFTTDGALIDPDFLLLRDDDHFWPAYHVAPVVRAQALKAHPGLASVLNQASARLDTQTLQQLNYQVDQQKRDYKRVIRDYLAGHP